MDAPNAPNPANPNAQGQFVDAVQGPTNQALKVLQSKIKLRVLQSKIKLKVLQTTMLKLVKMYPCGLHNNWPQVAAMLNYGEMQILENFKNTLPYQLYLTLINVNNLRDTNDLAKRVLMKEKLDRQLTAQSSTPFMRVTSNDNYSVPTSNKRGVAFDVMETLERNSDCIDKLTSLVSDMKMTIDRKQSPYKPRIYQGELGIKTGTNKILHLEIDPLVQEEIKVEIEEIIERIIGPITETDQEADGTIIGQVIGVTITRLTIDEVVLDQITDKMLNGHLEAEVKVEIRAGNYNNDDMRGRSRDRHNDRPIQSRQSTLSHGRDKSRSRSNPRVSTNHDHVRCYRCREYDHFASECPNMLTDKEPDCDDADPASLQMMTQDYYPIDSEGEIEYLNL